MRMNKDKTSNSTRWLAQVSRLLTITIGAKSFTRVALMMVLACFAAMFVAVEHADAVVIEKGTFVTNTATGNQVVTLTTTTLTPKAIIFFYGRNTANNTNTANNMRGMGFAAFDGTAYGNAAIVGVCDDAAGTTNCGRQRSITYALKFLSNGTPTLSGQGSVTAMAAGSFTVNWNTAPGVAAIVHYWAIGGADVSAKVGNFSLAAATGSQAVTGVGFQPQALFFLSGLNEAADTNTTGSLFNLGFATSSTQQGAISLEGRDARTGQADNYHQQRTDNSLISLTVGGATQDYLASLTSMDANGFTLNVSDAPTAASTVAYLALRGPVMTVGRFNRTTAAGNQSVTGIGFQPEGLLLASRLVVSATTISTGNSEISIGAVDSRAVDGAVWNEGVNALATTDTNMISNNAQLFIARTGSATADVLGDFVSYDANGFTINWGTAWATAAEVLYFALRTACTDGDLATLTTTNPVSSSTVNGTVTIQTQVGVETVPSGMTGMVVNVAGAGACNVTNGPMTWNAGSSRWEYSWNTSACGTVTPVTGVSITVSGTDPDCTTPVTAPAITNVTINNTCIAAQVTGLAAGSATLTTIPLTWTHPTLSVNYYNVYRDGVKISVDGAVTTGSFTDSGPLTPSTTYAYYIRGYNTGAACEGQPSSTVNKSTLAVTPSAPIVSNAGTGVSAYVTIGTDANSAQATYAIRVNTSQFVQGGGTLGASPVWQARAIWSTITVTGLTTNATYTFDVEARNGNGELIVSSPAFGPQTAVFVKVSLPATITSCSGCHDYPPLDGPRLGTTGAVTGDHGKHINNRPGYVCSICHVAPATTTAADYSHGTGTIQLKNPFSQTTGSYSLGTGFTQTNTKGTAGNPTGTCTNVGCHGYAAGSTTGNSPTPQWGVGTNSDCGTCHRGIVSALTASFITGGSITLRDAVVSEFGLAWGHKKSSRSAVSMRDCIVCHLEGTASQVTSTIYHANGYIDLRDPDGAGETRITDISLVSYSFTKFSTSYTAGSRSSAGHTFNTVDNILTQKFCLACHDSNGATNTTARSTNGVSAPTATSPFGNGSLGANYTVANGAAAAGGLVDVKTQVSSTWTSHPVVGPKNKDYPTAARLADPYKPLGTRGTSGTRSLGVVMNCFDCHNSLTPKTTRTVAAHGSNAIDYLRGVPTISGTPNSTTNRVTFCPQCHLGYDQTTSSHHAAGSALSGNTNNGMSLYLAWACNICHGTSYTTLVVRPVRGQDMHGSSVVPTGSITKAGRWATAGQGPIAFIRNSNVFEEHSPRQIGATVYTPVCMGGETGVNGTQDTPQCDRSFENYTVGGTY